MSDKEHKDEVRHSPGGHGMHAASGAGHEEHEGAPEWLISFADNVALMMGFFVILLAMNMKEPTTGGIGGKEQHGGAPEDNTRMVDFVIAMREAFNTPFDLKSSDPAEEVFRERIREKRGEGQSRQPELSGRGREAQAIRPTELSSLGGNVPFEDESETLSTRGTELAQEIGRKLRGQRWMIEVRGHASPSETFRNVENGIALSHKRALAVARELVAQGVQWSQIRLVACGDNERRGKREYDREADRQNQRVEVIVSGDPAPEEPTGTPSGAVPHPAPAPPNTQAAAGGAAPPG
ncbi:MAG: flagellar motor protein MotB [Phycisphaerales bacterium]